MSYKEKSICLKLLSELQDENHKMGKPLPLWLKIAPDLDMHQLEAIAAAASRAGVSAIVATKYYN